MLRGALDGFDSTATATARSLSQMPTSYSHWVGRHLLGFLSTVRGLLSLGLITLSVLVTRRRRATHVISPMVWNEVARSGIALFPLLFLLAAVLGVVVIGQTVALTNRVGAGGFLGTVMVTVVVRELGPLLAALVVLLRAGTASIIELGTARASREVEALELLGIDPIHYLVVPRVLGMALGVYCLTVYVIVTAVFSGYLWAFLQNIPILPGEYFRQLAGALHPLDFITLGVKSGMLGITIALLTCYHGLAEPITVEQLSRSTIRALTQGVLLCVLTDALFLSIYFFI